jgi:predicted metallopeptidase
LDVSLALHLDAQPPVARSPLVLSWNEPARGLPVRAVRPVHGGRPPQTLHAPGRIPTGPENLPFDFCGHIRRLCGDIARRSGELAHLHVPRILFGMTQARSSRTHGLQARVTPLRFHSGQLTRIRHGVAYQVQRYFVNGREMLYLITFCLPRFLDQGFEEKFVTLFHELYHISPAFDGDLRRHHGRCQFHSHSKRRYDEQMAQLARAYLATRPDPSLHAFLRLNFAQLVERHGSVVGVVVPRPKLVPVAAARG